MKTIIMSLVFFSAIVAKAEEHKPTQMNFNQMIDDNHQGSSELNEAMTLHYNDKKEAPKAEPKDEANIVTDFITYEVVHMKKKNVAAERPVVKRVYNSVE